MSLDHRTDGKRLLSIPNPCNCTVKATLWVRDMKVAEAIIADGHVWHAPANPTIDLPFRIEYEAVG